MNGNRNPHQAAVDELKNSLTNTNDEIHRGYRWKEGLERTREELRTKLADVQSQYEDVIRSIARAELKREGIQRTITFLDVPDDEDPNLIDLRPGRDDR